MESMQRDYLASTFLPLQYYTVPTFERSIDEAGRQVQVQKSIFSGFVRGHRQDAREGHAHVRIG